MLTQAINLIVQVLIAYFVWRYYRQGTYSATQRYSTFGPRFWTGWVDSCVLWPINLTTSILLTWKLPAVGAAIVIVLQNVVWVSYSVAMHTKYGQTYGKMVCKVRVVDHRTEGAVTFLQALVREGVPIAASCVVIVYEMRGLINGTLSGEALSGSGLGQDRMFWLLSTIPLFWFVAEVVTMLTNEKRRALHDYIAGTVVVRTDVA